MSQADDKGLPAEGDREDLPLTDALIEDLARFDDALRQDIVPLDANEDANATTAAQRLQRTQSLLQLVGQNAFLLSEVNESFRGIDSDSQPDVLRLGPRVESLEQVGRFHIVRELGRGGCGIVFLAFDPTLRRDVAVKIPHAGALLTVEVRERFLREGQAAAGMNHPNIVPVYEAGDDESLCYIASAYCPGTTLAHWLHDRDAAAPIPLSARILSILADAVQHAHDRGVLHRDLKPANILLREEENNSDARAAATAFGTSPLASLPQPSFALGQSLGFGYVPLVADFGLAKVAELDGSQTRSGMLVGTANYMAPEQAAGHRDADVTADVYSLGAILYEMLSGRPPFQGATPWEVIHQSRQDEPIPPRRLRPSVPHDLETICLKCLEKEPRQRYTSAGSLRDDLVRFVRGEPITAKRTTFAARAWRWCKRHRLVATLLGLILVQSLVAFVGVIVWLVQLDRTNNNLRSALWQSMVSEASVRNTSRRAGQRFQSLESLRHAYQLLPDPTAVQCFQLRTEAISALVNFDIEREHVWSDRLSANHRVVAFDSSVRLYAASQFDRTLDQQWLAVQRVDDNGEVTRWPIPPGHIQQLRFSPSGEYLAASVAESNDVTLVLFDLRDKSKDPRPLGQVTFGAEFDFSPDSRRLAIPMPATAVRVFDVEKNSVVAELKVDSPLEGCRYSPLGDQLAVWAGSHLGFLDPVTGTLLDGFDELRANAPRIASVAWSPDGRTVAAACSDHCAYLIHNDADSGRAVIRTLRGHQGWVTGVCFSDDGELLLTSSVDSTSRVWNTMTARLLLTAKGNANSWSHDGTRIGGTLGTEVIGWRVARGLEHSIVNDGYRDYEAYQISVSANDRWIATSSYNGVAIWDWQNRTEYLTLPAQDPTAVALAPRANFICYLAADGVFGQELWLAERRVGPLQRVVLPADFAPNSVSLYQDGRLLAIQGESSVAAFRVPAHPAAELPYSDARCFEHSGPIESGMSPTGRWLVTGALSGGLKIWDVESGMVVHEIPGIAPVAPIQFRHDGQQFLIPEQTRLSIWNVSTWDENHAVPLDHAIIPYSVKYAPDDSYLAMAATGSDRLFFFAANDGMALCELPIVYPAPWLEFSSSGQQLIHTGTGLSLEVLDIASLNAQLREFGLSWPRVPRR
ncbi:MAG: protein kinase [Planctomycetales bacterium]|nr:protein kinase [Planctomycetales bacterium]